MDHADHGGSTPLYMACQNNHLKVAALLLDKGANVDQGKSNGSTPLMAASG